MYPNLVKGNWMMSTCNRLDLQTLGCQLVMPKNLPNHWSSMPFEHDLAFQNIPLSKQPSKRNPKL